MISSFDNKSMLLWGSEIVDRLISIDKAIQVLILTNCSEESLIHYLWNQPKSSKFCWNYYNILGYELMHSTKAMWNIHSFSVDMGSYTKSIQDLGLIKFLCWEGRTKSDRASGNFYFQSRDSWVSPQHLFWANVFV